MASTTSVPGHDLPLPESAARQMTSIANQRLWIEARPGSDPPAAGAALAIAWEGPNIEYLVCDTGESGGGLAWVKAEDVAAASIRAPRSMASISQQRLWITSRSGTSPVGDGHALAVATDEHSSEYLVCDSEGQLVWIDADNVEKASIKKPKASRLPTKKVTATAIGGASAATLSTAGIALLEALGVDLTSEVSAALTSFITALAAFASGYARRDPAAVDTPAAEEAAAAQPVV